MYSSIRAEARWRLGGNWGMAILVTFVAGLLGALSGSTNLEIDADILQRLPKAVQHYLNIAITIGAILGVIQFFIGGVIDLGYRTYLLKLHDNEDAQLRDLFSQFDRFGDGFVLRLLTSIFTFLWTLLFIIPGIIATLRYAMAPYILAEHPEMTPMQALDHSKYLMDGKKLDLFLLELSFIGWAFLCGLTLGIGNLWLNPYMHMSITVFYRRLAPKPVKEPPVIDMM